MKVPSKSELIKENESLKKQLSKMTDLKKDLEQVIVQDEEEVEIAFKEINKNHKKQIEQYKEQLSALKKDNKNLKDNIVQSTHITKLQKKNDELVQQLEEFKNIIDGLRNEITNIKTPHVEDVSRKYRSRIDELKGVNNRNKETYEKEIADLKNEVKVLKGEKYGRGPQYSKLEKRYDNLMDAYKTLEKKNEDLLLKCDDSIRVIKNMRNNKLSQGNLLKIGYLEDMIFVNNETYNKEITKLDKIILELKSENERLKLKNTESYKSLNSFVGTTNSGYEKEIEGLKHQIKNMELTIYKTQQEVNSLNRKNVELKKDLRILNGANDIGTSKYVKLKNESIKTIKTLRAELEDSYKKYQNINDQLNMEKIEKILQEQSYEKLLKETSEKLTEDFASKYVNMEHEYIDQIDNLQELVEEGVKRYNQQYLNFVDLNYKLRKIENKYLDKFVYGEK